MFVTTYGVHHVAKAVRELSKTLGKSSILRPRGRVETDTAVEARADHTKRVDAEQRRRQQAHEELVARVLPHDRDKPKRGAPDTESEWGRLLDTIGNRDNVSLAVAGYARCFRAAT